MKKEPQLPTKPQSGVLGDPDVWMAYKDLYFELHSLINDRQDSSYGNISLGGVASILRSKANSITQKAKIFENILKAVCIGRR
jgi:hypothetical protein